MFQGILNEVYVNVKKTIWLRTLLNKFFANESPVVINARLTNNRIFWFLNLVNNDSTMAIGSFVVASFQKYPLFNRDDLEQIKIRNWVEPKKDIGTTWLLCTIPIQIRRMIIAYKHITTNPTDLHSKKKLNW